MNDCRISALKWMYVRKRKKKQGSERNPKLPANDGFAVWLCEEGGKGEIKKVGAA